MVGAVVWFWGPGALGSSHYRIEVQPGGKETMKGGAGMDGAGSTDLGRVGGPGVDPPEQLAAWNDLHCVLGLGHGVCLIPFSCPGTIILKWRRQRGR